MEADKPAPATGGDAQQPSRCVDGEAALSTADAAAPVAEVGRPKRERKQVERIRSSQLRTVTKRSPAKGQVKTAGKAKGKARASVEQGEEDEEDDDWEEEEVEEGDDDYEEHRGNKFKKPPANGRGKHKAARHSAGGGDDDEEDLDAPLAAARGSKPDAAENARKKTPRSGSTSQEAVKKRRVSQEEGPSMNSEESSLIRSALIVLCDELGEEELAETTPKVLRRRLEKQLDRDEGDLDKWKKVIIEWYQQAEDIKTALRKWLQDFDDTEATPKAIRRELERQLKLEEGKLDSWKAEIDRWTLKFSEEVDPLSPLRSPKGKSNTNDAVRGVSPHEKPQPNVSEGPEEARRKENIASDAAMRESEKTGEEAAMEKRVVSEAGSGDGTGEKRMASDPDKEKFSSSRDSDSGKEKHDERQEHEGREGVGAAARATSDRDILGSRSDGQADVDDLKTKSKNRDSQKQDARHESKDSKRDAQIGRDAGRKSGEYKGKPKDKERKEQQKDKSDRTKKMRNGSPEHQTGVSEQAEPSARREDTEDGIALGSAGKEEHAFSFSRVPSGSSKLLERRASLMGNFAGKDPSLLQLKPVERVSSEANEFRACPLKDLDELGKVMEAAEREAAVRKREEEQAAARRAKEAQEAAERKKRDERAQEKIREAAKKPLPSFKDLKKSKAAIPSNISTSTDSAGPAREGGGVLKKVPAEAAGKTSSDSSSAAAQRSVGFSPKVEQRLIENDDEKNLTPNTKSLQQYANAQHVGDILLQWGIISQDQVICLSVCLCCLSVLASVFFVSVSASAPSPASACCV